MANTPKIKQNKKQKLTKATSLTPGKYVLINRQVDIVDEEPEDAQGEDSDGLETTDLIVSQVNCIHIQKIIIFLFF